MHQDSLKELWHQLVKERANIIQLIESLSLRKAILDEAIPLLQKATAIDVSSILPETSQAPSLQNKNPYDDYPAKQRKQDKILFVLSTEQRAMLATEIQEIIQRVEGPEKALVTLKSFSYVISMMQQTKEVYMGKIDGSNKHTYYILPDFLSGEGGLKPEHAPAERTWDRLPVEKRNVNQIVWQKGGNMKA